MRARSCSYRSSRPAAWRTRANRGIGSASRAPTVRRRWPASGSPVATRSHTAPIALANCSPNAARRAPNRLPVSLLNVRQSRLQKTERSQLCDPERIERTIVTLLQTRSQCVSILILIGCFCSDPPHMPRTHKKNARKQTAHKHQQSTQHKQSGQTARRHRWNAIHLVWGSPLAQRLLQLRQLQNIAGRPWLHHRCHRHHLSGVCQAKADVKTTQEQQQQRVTTETLRDRERAKEIISMA